MANDTRVLFCLIEGDTNLFEVTVSTGESICFLKEVIQEKRKNRLLRDVDAADLVLWKVSRFSRNYPVAVETLLAAQRTRIRKISENS